MGLPFVDITDQLVPEVLTETDWKGGVNRLPSGAKALLLLGYKTTAGTLAAGVVKRITNDSDPQTWWGEGSHVAVMAQIALRVAPRAPIYGMSYAEGTSAVAALGTIVITGPATGSGTLTIWVGGRQVRVGIASTDTATIIGAALATAINDLRNAPFTAAAVTGTVTVTARNGGPEGNTIRMRGEVSAAGVGITVAATLTTGATAGTPTTVLAGIESLRFHLIALNTDDSTALASVKTHQEKLSKPSQKRWGMGIGASVGIRTAAEAITQALDSYRMQLGWLASANEPIFEVAADFAACRAKVTDVKRSLDDVELGWCTAPASETTWPAWADEQSALENGVTPLRPGRNGRVTIVRSIITAYTTPVVYKDHNITEMSDYDDEYCLDGFNRKYKGKPFKVLSPAGTPDTVTLDKARDLLYELMKKLDDKDILQGVDAAYKAGSIFAQVNDTDPDRIDLGRPATYVHRAHVIAILKQYTLP